MEATNFLMPAITPRYVRSAACRDELFKFYQRIEDNANSHVLSMVWQPIEGPALDAGEERARGIIQNHQYVRVNNLRDLSPSDPEYKAAVRKAASMLHDVILAQPEDNHFSKPAGDGGESEDGGLLELIDGANEGISVLQSALNQALDNVHAITNALNAHPAPSSTKPGVFSAWGAEVAKAARKDVERLNSNLDDLESSWLLVQKLMNTYFDIAPRIKGENDDALLMSLVQLRTRLELPEEFDTLADQMKTLQMLSPKLKPMATAMERLVSIVKGIVSSVDELIEKGERGR